MKIFSLPALFLRELVFDSKEEYDITSTSFNTKKVITFWVIVLSFILNIVSVTRTVTLALENIELNNKIEELSAPEAKKVDPAKDILKEPDPSTRSEN